MSSQDAPATKSALRLLLVTNMYPVPGFPYYGMFVKEQVESLRERGVQVEVLFMNSLKSPLVYLWGALRLIWKVWFHSRRYDVIQAHHGFATVIARLQWQLPLVATIHEAVAIQKGLEPFVARFGVMYADLPVVVNTINYNEFRDKRAVIQSCGVDLKLFSFMHQSDARKRLGITGDEKVVVFAADPKRLHKRFDLATAAVEILKKKGMKVRLHPMGKLEREDMPVFMSACDALIMPSDYESGPLVVKEALAIGLPVVAVPVGDVPEACLNRKNAYVVPNTPEALAEGLEKALAVPDNERIRQVYRWFDHEYVVDQLYELLLCVAGKNPGKRIVRGNLDHAVESIH
jgi:teichuronic acid biosynthesis glycosyltransferase TuaC